MKQIGAGSKAIWEFFKYFLAALGMALFIIHFIGQRTQVVGISMEPALSNQDSLIVDKLVYDFKEPDRFDIVVFPYPADPKIKLIKRVIGLPGEQVRIDRTGTIYINEEPLEEYYGKEPIENPGLAGEAILLGEDEYFLLGDNRNNSMDSRDEAVGIVKKKEIIGRASFRIFPLNAFGSLKNQ